jgi:ABC-type antimicrobial peptide transport system permease subunit
MKKTILALVIAAVAGLPLGWIVAMLLTPALWRLEPVLHMELAGHSGPSDWVFIVVWAIVAIVLFLVLRGLFKTGARS